jgi:hypothetical protein
MSDLTLEEAAAQYRAAHRAYSEVCGRQRVAHEAYQAAHDAFRVVQAEQERLAAALLEAQATLSRAAERAQ